MPDNQTKEEWLELAIVADNPKTTGTGVVIQSPGDSKTYMPNVSYAEMLSKDASQQFFAFAWVPDAVATYQQMKQASCGGRCAKTCKRPGCLCDRSIGQCK
jgi:hypothetical protein